MRKTVLIIVIVFIAALAVSVGIHVIISPDISGFGKGSSADPSVTYLSDSEGGAGAWNGGKDGYNWQEHRVFVIGDSLTHGARSAITNAIGDQTIDGKVGRTMLEGALILEDWYDSGVITDDAMIVVCLAHNITNTTVSDAQLVVDMIRPGQSLVMMTGHGRSNMEPINEFIRSLPGAYSYITAADWDLTIEQSPGLLSDDGIHIATKQGNELYANLILRALEVSRPMP